MKKLLCILLLFGLSIILSCNGAGYCHVEGNVFEEGSNIPIHNVYVRINKHNRSPFKEATTDENGHFKITYFKNSDYKISLDIISGEHISRFNIPVDSKNANISAFLTPYGFVKYRVKNNSANAVTVYVHMPLQDSYDYAPPMVVPAFNDITFDKKYRVLLNKYTKFSWYYYLNNPSTYMGGYNDSVIVTNKFNILTHTLQIN